MQQRFALLVVTLPGLRLVLRVDLQILPDPGGMIAILGYA
jgi:hypothetical protein